MSFGDEIDAATLELRELAEDRMRDTFVFERKTGNTVRDANDSDVDEYAAFLVTKGRMGVSREPREAEAGDRTTVSSTVTLHTPVAATAEVRVNDRVRCTAIGSMSDPALLGQVFEVVSTPVGSQKTARRWPVKRWEA